MKLNIYSLALIVGFGTLSSCIDRLELVNPNQQTSSTFGFDADDLEECVIAAYNHSNGRIVCTCGVYYRRMPRR